MRWLLLPTVLFVLTACGEPPVPCTECRDVAGTWSLVTEPAEPCETVTWGGMNTLLTIEQDGTDPSQLAVTLFDRRPGTLFEKDRFSFESATVQHPTLGVLTFTFSGTFFTRETGLFASVSLNANVPKEGCVLTTHGEMQRQ